MSKQGTVFVTGASTGIGRAAVERLAADGYDVIAGVRRDGDQPPSAASHVLVDLGEPETIPSACKEVAARAGGRLAGLVNNAGINVNGPFEVLPTEEWRRQFEVNLFGHLDVTRELLPALLAASGRIVTVGSIGGRFSAPFLAPYSASKFAVRAWMEALRIELAPHGVQAILVEPGSIRTEIWRKGNAHADALIASMTDEQQQRYAAQITSARKVADFTERQAIPAEKAAAVIAKALSARRPKGHYLVGVDARAQALVSALPKGIGERATRLMLRQPGPR
jgi:NAD(P)-dependent dehydrogenase (short-subunit alcohol dehydrogenase family)